MLWMDIIIVNDLNQSFSVEESKWLLIRLRQENALSAEQFDSRVLNYLIYSWRYFDIGYILNFNLMYLYNWLAIK